MTEEWVPVVKTIFKSRVCAAILGEFIPNVGHTMHVFYPEATGVRVVEHKGKGRTEDAGWEQIAPIYLVKGAREFDPANPVIQSFVKYHDAEKLEQFRAWLTKQGEAQRLPSTEEPSGAETSGGNE